MEEISYENIDLFYYHSIDIDFARLFSILNHGIVSQKVATEENIKYYYRNYTHASCKNEFISVSHFPQTVFRYYKIENELYNFNTNKIAFIIDGHIEALDKQAYRKKFQYTNERHVHGKIEPHSIKGILIRECDANKLISDMTFNIKYTDIAFFEHKVFSTIQFFKDYFGSFGNTNTIYYLIGKYRETQICGKPNKDIIESICNEMKKNINLVLSTVLQIPTPTLLDVIKYINNEKYPIYIMNKYDIQKLGIELKQTDDRLERFERNNNLTKKEIKEQEFITKKTLKLLKQMSSYGCDIYMDYSQGPFTLEDYEINENIKSLNLKK